MSDWSSFNDAKKQNDAWKKFLKEDVEAKEAGINEFFFGAKAKSGGKYNLSRDEGGYLQRLRTKGTAPSEQETYNADDVVALSKALDDINKALKLGINRGTLYDELEDLLTNPQGNNYVIQEAEINKASVILSKMPVLGPEGVPDAQKYPNLTKLFQGALTTERTRQHLLKALARAGFFGQDGDQIPNWINTPAPKTQATVDTDNDGVPDTQDNDADGDGIPNQKDPSPTIAADPRDAPDPEALLSPREKDDEEASEPEAEQEPAEPEEEVSEYEGDLRLVAGIKKKWDELYSDTQGANWERDMAAFIDFIGPYAIQAKESGVLKDPLARMNESLAQLVGRPGGEDNEAWTDSPFLRIGDRGERIRDMHLKLKQAGEQGGLKKDRIDRVLKAVFGPGGKAPSHRLARQQLLALMGTIKPAEQKEVPKDEPKQKAAAAPDAGSARFSRDKVRGQRARAKDTAAKIGRAGRGGFMEEAADTLNESKTIDRWKTLAGIK